MDVDKITLQELFERIIILENRVNKLELELNNIFNVRLKQILPGNILYKGKNVSNN